MTMSTLGVTGEYARELALALAMADDADAVSMQRYRAHDLVVTTKPDTTPVTEADQAVERLVRATLAEQMPADGIIGEEFGDNTGDAARHWIVDPIDGTKNYLRGVPVWSTLIGLAVGDEIVVGVVSAPAMGRRWWAAKGAGAWTLDVDGTMRGLHVSKVASLADASFSYSDAIGWEERASGGLQRLLDATWRQRAYGDFLSHVLVAEGAVDIAAEPELSPWDMAALIPVITEAGGAVSGYQGGNPLSERNLICSNGVLHEAALGLLR